MEQLWWTLGVQRASACHRAIFLASHRIQHTSTKSNANILTTDFKSH